MANMTFKANLIPQSDLGYELGSNNPTLKRWKIYGDIQPIVKKTYTSTGQYATEANSDKANFYFMSVKPETFLKPWTIQFKVRSFCPGYSNGGESITYCTLSGRNNSMIYHNWNERYEAIHYYICSLNLTQAGFNAGLGHAVGISILYGWNYTNSAYYRTFEVELYKAEGCTATLLDAPVLKANWPSYSTTNYSNHNHYNAVDRGLLETADWDTTGRDYSHSGYLKNGSQFRCPPNTLFGLDRNNSVQAISLYSADYTGGTVSINTARVYNTAGIDWTKGLYYSNSGSNFAASADMNISPAVFFYAMDLRYTDNCVPTSAATTLGMVPRKMVYLRGTIHSDGLFYLAPMSVTYNSASYKRVWTQDIPTAVETDGTYQYVYWEIGMPYYNSSYANGGYQVNLHDHNKLYWFNNGRFEEYSAGGRGIQNITRSGTTFTVTRDDGTTFTFTQQDNNNTYTLSSLGGVGTVSASGTAPLTLSASKSGTTVSITGSIAAASTSSAGVTQYTAANLNTWLNQLTTGSSDPTDADWYISQYAGGGTTTTSFHRRPVSALYNYIKTKLAISNKNATLSYGGTSTIASIGGTDIKVTMPASDNTNNAVTQTATDSSNANYEILFSATADNTTRTEGARKTSGLIYNPSTRLLTNTGATNASGEYRAVRGSYGMWMGFGSGNANHGLYSQVKDNWMIYSDASGNVYVNGNANTATKTTQDESGNNIKATYASSFSISDHTITLKNKNGASLGTVTVPDNNTLNTAGSTDTSSKIFLIGATSQAANPQTYSDNQVYATNGQLDANKMRVAEHVTLQYNTTTAALDFVFA